MFQKIRWEESEGRRHPGDLAPRAQRAGAGRQPQQEDRGQGGREPQQEDRGQGGREWEESGGISHTNVANYSNQTKKQGSSHQQMIGIQTLW